MKYNVPWHSLSTNQYITIKITLKTIPSTINKVTKLKPQPSFLLYYHSVALLPEGKNYP